MLSHDLYQPGKLDVLRPQLLGCLGRCWRTVVDEVHRVLCGVPELDPFPSEKVGQRGIGRTSQRGAAIVALATAHVHVLLWAWGAGPNSEPVKRPANQPCADGT